MQKKCYKCKQVKSADGFYKNKSKKDGLAEPCKQCSVENGKTYHSRQEKAILLKKGKKICSKCRQIKSFDKFNKNKSKKDGLCTECGQCVKWYCKKYYLKNGEIRRKRQREYYLNNLEEMKVYAKQQRIKHKERIRKYKKEYHVKHREEILNKHKEYRLKNKEKISKARRKWYEDNKEIKLARDKKYVEKNRVAHNRREKQQKKGYRETLHDLYIKSLIVGKSDLKYSDIPKELIEAKRQHLKIKRIIKGE